MESVKVLSEPMVIGYAVIALTAIITLFSILCKPLNENTKAMASLTLNIEHLTEKIEEQNKRIDEQERNFSLYKDHMRESQKRQWEVLDKHTEDIQNVTHELALCKKEHKTE